MPRTSNHRSKLVRFLFLVLLALGLPIGAVLARRSLPTDGIAETLAATSNRSTPSPEDAVRLAWRRAQASGAYRFTTEIVQTTYPAPALVNVGRSSTEQRLTIEGEVDAADRAMAMTIWQGGGWVGQSATPGLDDAPPKDGGEAPPPSEGGVSPLADGIGTPDAVYMRVEGDRAYGRTAGGQWQEVEDVSGAFAPGADPLAYLAGARDLQPLGAVGSDGLARYEFQVDGPAFAEHLRSEMQDYLRRNGRLPARLTLAASDLYKAVTGEGELVVNAAGYPARIAVTLVYPQQANGERIEAEIHSDFYDFALLRADAGLPFLPVQLRAALTPERLQAGAQQMALGMGFLGLLAVVVLNHRSRVVYSAFALVVVASMVAVPLVESVQAAAYYDEMAGASEARAAEHSDVEAPVGEAWDPHQNPLRAAPYADLGVAGAMAADSSISADRGEAASVAVGAATNPFARVAVVEEEPPDADSDDDNDSLTYAQEMMLGTVPTNPDSDGDSIRDDVEVHGFEWPAGSGIWWYSDPNNPDTNDDGLPDGMECYVTAPDGAGPYMDLCDKDTDGDGVPDLFDRDNDDDGVPDREDLSPGRAVRSDQNPFEHDAPFTYRVTDLAADKPVFVDFQVRPADAAHLTYALNVLDWPAGDHDGQVQRHATATADATFQSVAEAADEDYGAQDGNGDVRLVPMLEITVPYDGDSYGNLPVKPGAPATRNRQTPLDDWLDTSKFAPYGISVRSKNDNGDLVAYTPLNVVPDETGGGRVAFSARMLYWPNAADAWDATTHKARVVWVVVALVDSCDPVPIGTSEAEAETWCDDVANWTLNQATPIHTYPEAWYLTGFAVREDHGLDVALVLEDPDADADLAHDDNLWLLANGLESAFLTGRDEDENDVRDLAIDAARGDTTIAERFDADLNAGVSDEMRWEIPDDSLQVATFSYDHQDFIAHVMMTETTQVLDSYFTDGSGDPKASAPTLLFAREEHYRGVNLDDATATSVNGRQVTVSATQANALPTTMATLSWAPYRYRDGQWTSYDMVEYWDLMEVRFKEIFPPEDPDDPESVLRAVGQVALARSYYLSLFNGVTGLVRLGDNRVWDFAHEETDSALAGTVVGAIKGIGKVVTKIAQKLCTVIEEVLPVLKVLGGSMRVRLMLYYVGLRIKGALQDVATAIESGALKARLASLRSGGGGGMSLSTKLTIGAAVAGAVVGVAVLAAVLARGGGVGDALKAVSLGLQVFGALTGAIQALQTFVRIKISGLQQVVRSFNQASQKAGIVGLIISIVVTWAAFVAVWAVSGVMIGSMAWNAMLAGAIASTVLAVVMFAIGLHPVGLIILAIVAVIDAVILSLCAAFGWEEGKVGEWVCKGISGLANEAIQRIIYGNYVMVDMDADDRLEVTNYQQDVLDPQKGIQVGNSLALSTDVTTTLSLAKTPGNWMAYAYYWQYSQSTLKSATFDYALQPTELDLHPWLSRNDMKEDWVETPDPDDGSDIYQTWTVTTDGASVSLTDAGAGINRPVALYLSEGHAVPAQECWAVPVAPLWGVPPVPCPIPPCTLAPVCYVRSEKATNHIDLGTHFRYDIFPETVDGFYEPVAKDGGFSLAWGQDTAITSTVLSGESLTFPRMVDFDGDGLRNPADGGADPDDSLWDTDGDGLSDRFELAFGSDPTRYDTDGDGLADNEEAGLETDPNRRDSDADGLTDWEEVEGWEFVYGFNADGTQVRSWVTSNPADPDTDGDGLTDFQEKTYGFNPRAYSDPTILSFESQVREADAPSLLLRFEEAYGAATFADSSGTGNSGVCEGATCPTSGVEGGLGLGILGGVAGAPVLVSDDPSLDLTTFSVGAWVKPDQARPDNRVIVAKEEDDGTARNYALYLADNTLNVRFSFHAANCTTSRVYDSATALDADQWSHVMMTYDGERLRLYINGDLDRDIALTSTVCQNDAAVKIGGEVDAFRPFRGGLDEVTIFDRALSRGAVQGVMAGRYNPNDSFVRPGDPLAYAASVTNELYNRYAQGLLSTEMPGLLAADVAPTTFVIGPQQRAELAGTVTVDADLDRSAQAELTQVAGAVITDRREQSNFAELWLRLDEGDGAQTFTDFSGSQPPRNASCSGASCPTAGGGGAFGYALAFDGVNDYVSVRDTALLRLKETSFSVSAWIKGDAFGSGGRAVVGTDGTGTNQGLFLGVSGGAPHMGFVSNGLNSGYQLQTGDWYHVVYRYDAVAEEMAIFVNGEERAAETGHVAFQGSGMVYLGRAQSGKYFDGVIDDVRIFERALSFDEVRELYTQPVFRMGFEEPLGSISFLDGTGFESNGLCWAGQLDTCPGRTTGVNGQAANFGGTDYIYVQPNAPLDMSEGQFTISSWVYPKNTGSDSVRNYAQGIFGKYTSHRATNNVNGDKDAYPTLLRVGRKLRFGFGDGSRWYWRTTGDVLRLDGWNHVAVTFGPTYATDGTFDGNVATIYVDNVVAGNWNFGDVAPTRRTKEFYIGRSTDQARVNLDSIYVNDEGDMAGDAELYVMWGGEKIWYDDGCDEGETLDLDMQLDYIIDTTLQVWEDDRAGQGEVGPDDLLIEETFSLSKPQGGSRTLYGEGGYGPTKVTLSFADYNSAIPFRGAVDELVMYKRAFTEGEVEALYYAGAAGLQLAFDDPPGSTSFENATGPNTGSCSTSTDDASNTCPTAGVDGQLNQAVRFDGVNDVVEVEMDVSEETYGSSLWFNTPARTGVAKPDGVFSIDRGELSADGQDREIYLDLLGNLCASTRDETLCTSGVDYRDAAWHHVAHAVGSRTQENPLLHMSLDEGQADRDAFRVRIWDNKDLSGTPLEVNDDSYPLDYNWSDNDNFRNVSLRWVGDFYFEQGTYTFHARADDGIRVWIDGVLVLSDWTTHSATNYTVVHHLTRGVHTIKVEYFQGGGDAVLQFDWSPLFTDSSSYLRHATCEGTHCPISAGGTFRRALDFDGVNDFVDIRDFNVGDDFTISLWVNPDTVAKNQALIAKNAYNKGNLLILGLYNGAYMVNLQGEVARGGTPTTGWQHLVVTGERDGTGTRVTLYRDGLLLWEETLDVRVGALAGLPWSLGQEWDPGGRSDFFDGKLDEVRIYGRALSLAEVEELAAPHRLYVDGALVAAGQTATPGLASQDGVNIGFSEVPLGLGMVPSYFSGRIDDVRIFHQPLSGSSVTTLYRAAPQFRMRFDESTPSCAFRTEIYTDTTLSGTPAETRCDPWPISYDWGSGGPEVGGVTLADNFSVRWTGDLTFPEDGVYTFSLRTQDGVRLIIDGVLRSNHWANTTPQTYEVQVDLDAGVHEVQLAYQETTGDATIELTWVPFFMDASGNGNHGGCADLGTCPTVGVAGQVGLAAAFDGVDDVVIVPDDRYPSALQQGTFTVGGWVQPTATKDGRQPIIAKENADGQERNYALFLVPESTQVRYSFQADNCSTWHAHDSVGSLILNSWNHVMMTYDGTYVSLYINGYLDSSVAVSSGVCQRDVPLKMGNELDAFTAFAGQLDEMALYDHALSAREVRDIFLYQGKWVEERQHHAVIVDVDDPTSELVSARTDGPDYRANHDVMMQIAAGDPTSRVALAELGISKDGGARVWTAAPECQDAAAAGTAWCPTFDPTVFGGEGVYTLRTRAIDLVGHRATAGGAHTIYVDATPPTPSSALAGVLAATPHPSRPNAWIVRLSGRVTDPVLGSGDAGSGVAPESVRVTLMGAGGAAGAANQGASVAGATWALDYVMTGDAISGVYDVVVTAADAVGNRATATVATLTVDADAPTAYPSVADLPTTITQTQRFGGTATEHAVPVEVALTPDDGGAAEVGLRLTCGADVLLDLSPLQLAAESGTLTWQRTVHRGSACELTLLDSAGDGGSTGSVRVCGDTVVTWDAAYGAAATSGFTADAAGCGATLDALGVDRAETAFTPVFGDAPFSNVVPPAGQVLHLAFEAQPDPTGAIVFGDLSGNDLLGACDGTACPATGQAGPSGSAAAFDGVDDVVVVETPADSPFFTVAAWVKRTGVNAGRETIVDFGCGAVLSLNEDRWGGAGEHRPLIQAYTDAHLQGYDPVAPDTWVHLAAVRDRNDVFRLYRDGRLLASTTLTWASADCDHPTVIGASPSDGGFTDHFPGLIDEVRLFDRGLSADEVRALYLGAGPLVALPFEVDWGVDGAQLLDASERGHDGTLQTGDGLNKAIVGKVGGYALTFDGVDDYMSVAPHPGLRLDRGGYTQMAWIYPTPEDAGRMPIIGSGAYHRRAVRYPFIHVVDRTRLQVGFGDGSGLRSFTTEPILTEGAWQHVAVTFDGTTATVNVDGTVAATSDVLAGGVPGGGLTNSADRFDVGRGGDLNPAYVCATLSELTFVSTWWNAYGYTVTVDGEPVWQGRLPLGRRVSVLDAPLRICGSTTVALLGVYGGGLDALVIDPVPGSDESQGTSGDFSWTVTEDGPPTFNGAIDDVRVYGRALSAAEVQAAARGGWQEAALDGGGDAAAWQGTVPAGLEGVYRLDLRSWDAAVGPLSAGAGARTEERGLWRGDVDTLAPRVAMAERVVGDQIWYGTRAEDFNLTEVGFTSPCGPEVVSARETYADPVYLAGSGDGRLTALEASCWVDADRREIVGAYDTAGLAYDVAVGEVTGEGTYAYVVERGGTLAVVDVSDPTAPQAVTALDLPVSDLYEIVLSEPITMPTTAGAAKALPAVHLRASDMGLYLPVRLIRDTVRDAAAPAVAGARRGIRAEREEVRAASSEVEAAWAPMAMAMDVGAGLPAVSAAPQAQTATMAVVATDPAGSGRAIEATDAISVTFDALVDAATVTSRTFAVRGSMSGLRAGPMTVDGSVVTVGAAGYLPGEDVMVSLSGAIASTTGDPLQPYTWQFRVAPQGGTGVFTDTGHTIGYEYESYATAAWGDLDGDGDLDGVLGTYPEGEVWLNDGGAQGGTPGDFSDSGLRFPSEDLWVIRLGDVDDDGDLDAYLGYQNSTGLYDQLWRNDGNGVLTDTLQRLSDWPTTDAAFGDLDGDSDLDLVVSSIYGDAVWTQEGVGTGVFTQTYAVDMVSGAIGIGDVDGDGDLDIVGEAIWLNDGGLQGGMLGDFYTSGLFLSAGGVYGVRLADLDNDGDLDILFLDGAYVNRLWMNQGGAQGGDVGTFVEADWVQSGPFLGTALGDVDWDGDLDALAQARIWPNHGTGVFTESLALTELWFEHGDLGDVDGDGDLDAILSDNDMGTRIYVNNPNPPTASDTSVSTAEGTPITIMIVPDRVLDADGDAVTLTAVGVPANGAASHNDVAVTYTPDAPFNGTDAFTYTVQDAGGVPASAWITVSVNSVNDPPVALGDVAATDEDVAVTIAVLSNDFDPDGQTPQLVAVGTPETGTAAKVGSGVTYTPSPDVVGTDTFTYTISDGALSATGWVTVTMAPVNDSPAFTPGPDVTVAEDSGALDNLDWATEIVPGPATAVDEVGQTVAFTVTHDAPALFAVDPTLDGSGSLSFTPADDAYGTAEVTVMAWDDGGTANGGVDVSDPVTFTLTITNVNDAPVATDLTRTVAEDTVVVVAASDIGTDIDGDPLVVSDIGDAVNGTTAVVGGTAVYTPPLDFHGVDAFPVVVADPGGLTAMANVTVTLLPVNDAPTLTVPEAISVTEDAPMRTVALTGITSGAVDEDQVLTVTARSFYQVLIPAPVVSYTSPLTTGSLSFRPQADRFGDATLEVTVSDGISETVATLLVPVVGVNDPPTLDPLADLTLYAEEGSQTVTLSGIDAGPYETQQLTVTATSSDPALLPGLDVSYASPAPTGTLTLTPATDRAGTTRVAVTVTDGLVETVRTFDITVRASAMRFAYIIDRDGAPGLLVVDVSDPAAPALVGSTATPGYPTGLAVAPLGTDDAPHALIASWHRGLQIVDLTDPTAPEVVGGYADIAGLATDIAVSGDRAYVMTGADGLYVVDVSDPTAPTLLGVFNPPLSFTSVAALGTEVILSVRDGRVLRFDMADVSNPALLGQASASWGVAMAIVGDTLFTTGFYDGFTVFDLSSGGDPLHVGTAETPGLARGFDVGPLGAALNEAYAYVADDQGGLLIVDLGEPSRSASACDTHGRCTTVSPVATTSSMPDRLTMTMLDVAPAADLQAAEALSVAFPDLPAVLDRTDPLSFTVEAATSADVGSLQLLTVTVTSAVGGPATALHTASWAAGVVTETVEPVAWTPPAAGRYVMGAEVADDVGNVATTTLTVTVDLLPPAVAVAPTVLTQTHTHAPSTLDLLGWVADDGGVAAVDVVVRGTRMVTGSAVLGSAGITQTWRYPIYLGFEALPDGEAVEVTARATDRVGRVTMVTETVVVDVVPPTPGVLTLASGGTPLVPGAMLRAVSPTLTLSWEPSTDGSGIAGYSVDWTVVTGTATVQGDAVTTRQTVTASRTADFAASDGQRVAIQVGSTDGAGNRRWQPFGSVMVDSPLTPDFVPLDEVGWMASGCSLMGVDRRLDAATSTGAALDGEQRFYTSWDAAGLRMAWTGANWTSDGDLLVLLDTGAGGATALVDPYTPDGAELPLPAGMAADALVWVWDSATAVLLAWDGADWAYVAQLGTEQVGYTAGRNGGQTDLYVPFALLGIDDPAATALDVVALATEEGMLAPWAAMPNANAVSSTRVVGVGEEVEAGTEVRALSHRYHWDSLGAGVCPNGSDGSAGAPGGPAARYGDADLQVELAPVPVEAGVMPDGRSVQYALTYHNQGSEAAVDVVAALRAHGALRLPGGAADPLAQTMVIGTVAAGARGVVTIDGVVDLGACRAAGDDCDRATLEARLYDAGHPATGAPAADAPLAQLWADHQVDSGPPVLFGVAEPATLIGPGATMVRGYAHDEAGVPLITLDVLGRGETACPDATPDDGAWRCRLGLGGATDGELVSLRMRATDGHGQESAWGDWRILRVDAAPPAVTLDLDRTQAFPGALLRQSAYRIAGDVWDEGEVARVDVCVDGTCGEAGLQKTAAGTTGRWSLTTPGRGLPGAGSDFVTQTVTIAAEDSVGNRTVPPLTFNVTVDTVSPVVTVTEVVATAVQTMTTRVLTGTFSDGGPLGVLYVAVEAPSGKRTLAQAHWTADGVWTFDMSTVFPGVYRLWPTAVDLAGNEAMVGPYEVAVTLPEASRPGSVIYLPVVANDHVAAPDLVAEGLRVTETAVQVVVRNVGSVPVADAFWVDLYIDPDPVPTEVNQVWQDLADQGMVWGVTTPLAPGEAITLTEHGAYYWGEYSDIAWPLDQGTPVFVQVDSANADSVDGGVRETHEILSEPTNNIAASVVTDLRALIAAPRRDVTAMSGQERLPPRPPGR